MKKKIPKALREQVWLKICGRTFEHKCKVDWCKNIMTPFQFEAGHIVPESKGGNTNLENLLPICGSCNRSMGNRYSITEFSNQFREKTFEEKIECFRFFKRGASKRQISSDSDSRVCSHQDLKVAQ